MFSKRIGIDLGTANSIVFVEGKGIVLEEPTVVAIGLDDGRVLAVGKEAKLMLGKTPENIVAKRPLKNGVIASYRITEAMIKYFINKSLGYSRLFKPEVVVSVPAGVTSVEERAVMEATLSAGAKKAFLIPEPLAAAIGAQLPIASSSGNLIVNMGGGTAEIAVISLNGIVTFDSVRVAGDALNDAIATYIRKKHGLLVGEQTAEQIKLQIGTAIPLNQPLKMEIRGRDVTTGMPRPLVITSNDIVESIRPVLNQIIFAIKGVLEKTPPELSSDIIDRGMVLSGGTAMLKNIDVLFTKITGVPAHVVEDPIHCVVRGTGEALNHIDVLKRSLKG